MSRVPKRDLGPILHKFRDIILGVSKIRYIFGLLQKNYVLLNSAFKVT